MPEEGRAPNTPARPLDQFGTGRSSWVPAGHSGPIPAARPNTPRAAGVRPDRTGITDPPPDTATTAEPTTADHDQATEAHGPTDHPDSPTTGDAGTRTTPKDTPGPPTTTRGPATARRPQPTQAHQPRTPNPTPNRPAAGPATPPARPPARPGPRPSRAGDGGTGRGPRSENAPGFGRDASYAARPNSPRRVKSCVARGPAHRPHVRTFWAGTGGRTGQRRRGEEKGGEDTNTGIAFPDSGMAATAKSGQRAITVTAPRAD